MNKKITLTSVVLSGALLASSAALAEKSSTDGWAGSATLGAVITSGNSDTKNINGSANVTKEAAVWEHTAFGGIYNAENNGVETAKRFDLGYKLSRKINDRMYVFGRLRYDSDEYGNIDGRFSGVVGIGNKFIDTDRQKLSGEIGIGAQKTTFMTLTPVLTSDGMVDPAQTPLDNIEEESGTVYGGLKYKRIFNDKLTFNSDFGFEAAESNTSLTWDNSLAVKMSDKFSLSLGLLTRNNTDIVGQLGEKTDTATRIGVVYDIK